MRLPLVAMALVWLASVSSARAACSSTPELRDPDEEVTMLVQNLKFIITGGHREERAQLLAQWLEKEGKDVDLLLLSEARLTGALEDWHSGWCFYTQTGDGLGDGYRWAPISAGRSPGGLAMGVRQRDAGPKRRIGGIAGKRYRAAPVTLAEGLLGRIVGYRKGWAGIMVDGTQIVWSHTQASYHHRPDRGAGGERVGRAGQFADLAKDLGRPSHPTLVTGDLNLLAGFRPKNADDEERVKKAREIDDHTVGWFQSVTGLDLNWLKGKGTFAGSVKKGDDAPTWDSGAFYDRVGVNAPFLARHAGTRVEPVDISDDHLRVSDHLGLEIRIPFRAAEPLVSDTSTP